MIEPGDEAALAEAVASAKGPLAIQGGGTRTSGRRAEGEALSVAGLSGITFYEPGALTMVAKAGTPVAAIEAALAAEGQMLAFEPFDLRRVTGASGASTIGGVFASNASGARRVQAGAARDHLLGVRFVDGTGALVKSGGRVMKNVTGYDLVKLMAGSRGTLGVLSELSFKVLPKPAAQLSLEIGGLSDGEAVRAMSAAMRSPYSVTGALHAPACIEEVATTLIRVEGSQASVAYRAERLAALLREFGDACIADAAESWQAARGMMAFGRTLRGPGTLWSVSLRPSDAPDFVAGIVAAHACLYSFDWAGGRIWIWTAETAAAQALHDALQGAAAARKGHATLIHSAGGAADRVALFQPEPAPLAAIAAGLRAKFDPRGILNPGLMAPAGQREA